jgi:serine/threonine protein phosphatase PrpC
MCPNKILKSEIDDQKTSYFALFDGHAGSKCCDFLRDYLHHYITLNEYFTSDKVKALKEGIIKAESEFKKLILNSFSP